jgi:hypothetical protein
MAHNTRLRSFLLCTVVFVLAVVLSGCETSTSKPAQPKTTATPTAGDEAGKGTANAAADQADPTPGLAKLSPDDRNLAAKQKYCPVSDELLGAMAKPVKITVKGQTVFLCCSGCEESIKKDPDKYLAKLKKRAGK